MNRSRSVCVGLLALVLWGLGGGRPQAADLPQPPSESHLDRGPVAEAAVQATADPSAEQQTPGIFSPMVILGIGVAVVIGMIVALRVNAFIALITAAMVVSLLASQSLSDSIARVAGEFGSVVGKIGIVIAMAAVIGKCMMDSGAADRVVRWFLRLLGERRAPAALMGSGFVLAIPVFFDTVFYLLVPLARSLWRRTKKNYMLYILAISTGGAITHTLVPPTPGPLFMASELNIDFGIMMLVGTMIAFPTAVAGLLVCKLINRWMDVPMRPYAGEPEPEPIDDDRLPPFWLSILPVVLPVVLISANTCTKTLADAEHAARFRPGDVADWSAFGSALADREPGPNAWAVDQLRESLSPTTLAAFSNAAGAEQVALDGLNEVLRKKDLFQTDRFAPASLPKSARALLATGLGKLSQAELERFHRLVLESLFPALIRPHLWDTPSRKAAHVTSVLGDPNLALLLSAAIAMLVLVRYRNLSLTQLAAATENALMSGGVIILITAGGGAFGAMLRAAGVRQSIEAMIGGVGSDVGVTMVLAAFAVAAVLKIAQGSSTVAMITTASMFAAMGVTSEMLGFHCVYLATAIGCGSLVGSWMNDSGFWIFARMGNVTETEALKSWTILLAIIATVGLAVTLVCAQLLPLI